MRKLSCVLLVLITFPFILLLPVHAQSVATSIRVGVNINIPPYQFSNEDGEFDGIHIDLFDMIAKANNLQPIYIGYRGDVSTYEALTSDKVDVALGMRNYIPNGYNFAQVGELTSSSLCMVAANDIAKTIMQDMTPYYHYTLTTDFMTQLRVSSASLDQSQLGLTMRYITANAKESLDLLLSGESQMAIMDKQTVIFELNRKALSKEYTILINYLTSIRYTILVHSNDMLLQRTLEVGLSNLRLTQNYQEIMEKWIYEKPSGIGMEVIRITAIIVCIAAIIIAANLYINYLLKRKVTEKTRELYQANDELIRRMSQLEQEQRLRNELIENSPSGMVIFDENYTIHFINHRAQEMADYSPEAKPGEDIRKHVVFGRIIAGISENVFSYERIAHIPTIISLEGENGKKDYRYIIYCPLAQNPEISVLIAAEDVTTEEKYRQEMQEEEHHRALNMLVAGIAHEIRNPLMSIQTYTASLPKQFNNMDFLTSFAQYIPQEVKRINRLVESLIRYAQPVSGTIVRFDFAEFVRESLYLAEAATLNKQQIELNVDLAQSADVLMDKDKMKQTILNIVSNGVESVDQKLQGQTNTEQRLKIHIWTSREGGKIHLHFRDEGVGMTEAEIRRCIEPFFTTKSTGTGMGMTLVKQFVQDNDGLMRIESVKGEFTEITLSFWEVKKDDAQNTNY